MGPLVGAVVGGILGAAAGGMHANSLMTGALRLSGGKAKGGDDLVRCVEYKKPSAESSASTHNAPLVGGCSAGFDEGRVDGESATLAAPYSQLDPPADDAIDEDWL